ncbi:uncharacterized protein [Aristolochia californica]|uniref:uncharacterized protein n=1 Tax=Aristolochia californica TaxID=171875 RepID=UPI0035D699D1
MYLYEVEEDVEALPSLVAGESSSQVGVASNLAGLRATRARLGSCSVRFDLPVFEQSWEAGLGVLRHGDRIDKAEPLWVANAARPWDPPLTDASKMGAWCTGKNIRRLNFRISRVFVSPFYRCIQTASEAVAALCAVDDDSKAETSQNAVINASKVKVLIGNNNFVVVYAKFYSTYTWWDSPKKWLLEAMLPSGTVDHIVERIYKELPKWQEETQEARSRYEKVIIALENKIPCENLLFVTHGKLPCSTISSCFKSS